MSVARRGKLEGGVRWVLRRIGEHEGVDLLAVC